MFSQPPGDSEIVMAKVYSPGDVIGNAGCSVQITKMICIAGQGIAYRGALLPAGTPVFVKQLNADLKSSGGRIALKRFQRERSIELDTPQVPKCLGHFDYEGASFFVTEYIEGQTLEEKINSAGDPLSNDKARYVAEGVATVLAMAHKRGIVHRDIKPANVMIAPDDTVVVVDWGLCGFVDAGTLCSDGNPMGTIFFMSPEHIKGCDIDRQSDLFSLGIMLFLCLTREYPFDGEDEKAIFKSILYDPLPPIDSLNPAVDSDLQAIIGRLVAKIKTERYPDADALLIDLKEGFGASIPGDRCKHCGQPVASDVRFCIKCGAATAEDSAPFDGALAVMNGIYAGMRIPLSPSGTTVGRSSLGPDDDFISRNHAKIFHADGRYWIEDLDSLNGTSVNALALPRGGRHPLAVGDRIRLADTFCEFGR